MPNRKTALNKDPRVRTQPVTTGNEQAKGKISPDRVTMERLSPGVYRSASGGLVSGQGRPIERQPQAPMQQPQAPMPNMQNPWRAPVDDMVGRYPPGSIQSPIGFVPGFGPGQPNAPMDKMYREPPMYQWNGMPQMPQPSANMGGQYRLSPGVYGSREQAMQQYNDQFLQMQANAMPQYNKR
jgi:hypothetical protein